MRSRNPTRRAITKNPGLAAHRRRIAGARNQDGGWTKGNKSTAKAEFFDPTTRKFTATHALPASAAASAAALLTSGALNPGILVAGGFGGTSKFVRHTVSNTITGTATSSLEIYNPATGLFAAAAAPLLMARVGATATTLVSGKVLIAGGTDSSGNPTDTAEVFDPTTGTTTATSNNMNAARAFHSATLFDSGPLAGQVLVAGGATDNTGDLTTSADLYDPGTGNFTATGDMGFATGGHAAVILTTGSLAGQVLFVGGIVGNSSDLTATSSAQTYDPVGKTFSDLFPGMNDPRAFLTGTVLASGKVLLVGGFTNFEATVSGGALSSLFGSTLKSAEVYDPVANTFTCINGTSGTGGFTCSAAMAIARAGHTATLFTAGPLGGQVLVAGGIGAVKPNSTSSELNETELYNPVTGSNGAFTKVASLKTARGFHSAVLLP